MATIDRIVQVCVCVYSYTKDNTYITLATLTPPRIVPS